MATVTPDSIDDISFWASTDLEAFLRNDSVEPQPSSSKHTAVHSRSSPTYRQTEQGKEKKKKKKKKPQKTFNKDYQVCKEAKDDHPQADIFGVYTRSDETA